MADTIKLGNSNISLKVGDSAVTAAYLGNDLVYAPSSGLPSGYTQVEYVENQNEAYINTLFKPNQDTRIIGEMQCVTSTNSVMHWGAGGWDRVDGMWLTYETGINGTLHVAWLGQTRWSTYGNGDYNKHTYDWNKNELYKDNVFVGSSTYGTYQSLNNLAIFANLQGEGNEHVGGIYMKGKLFSFKIYDDGTLVRDFIPCTRDSDSKAGVYDIVNGVFYSSANSGYELIAPQGGGGGLVQIPYGTDMSQYYNRQVERFVINDTAYLSSDLQIHFGEWGSGSMLNVGTHQWSVYGNGAFAGVSSLPIDVTFGSPEILFSWSYNNSTINPFDDLQIKFSS